MKGVGFRGPVLPPKTMVWLVMCRPGHSLRGQDVSVKIQLWHNFQGTNITYPTEKPDFQPEHHRLDSSWYRRLEGICDRSLEGPIRSLQEVVQEESEPRNLQGQNYSDRFRPVRHPKMWWS